VACLLGPLDIWLFIDGPHARAGRFQLQASLHLSGASGGASSELHPTDLRIRIAPVPILAESRPKMRATNTVEVIDLRDMASLRASGRQSWACAGFQEKPAWPTKSPWVRRPASKSGNIHKGELRVKISKLYIKMGV
jgi:hypothetical protein